MAKPDPFQDVREDEDAALPIDKQRKKQKNAIFAAIRQQYGDYAALDERPLQSELTSEWIADCVERLIREPHFWALSLDEAVVSYATKPPEVKLKKDWLAGLHLRGFYDHYKTFDEGYDDWFVRHEQTIVATAEYTIDCLLQQAEGQAESHSQRTTTPARIAEVKVEMVALCKLINQEKAEALSRNRLTTSTEALGPIIGTLPKSKSLLDKFFNDARSGRDTVLDKFGEACTELWSELIEKATSTDFVWGKSYKVLKKEAVRAGTQLTPQADESIADDEDDFASLSSTDKSSKKQKDAYDSEVADKADKVLSEPPAQYEWLQEHFASDDYMPITYPCWAYSDDAPFDLKHIELTVAASLPTSLTAPASTDADENTDSQGVNASASMKTIWRHSSSFIHGRLLSEKEVNEPIPNEAALVKKCLASAKNTIDSASAGGWDALVYHLVKMGFTERGFYDNWYHVRKLLQALVYLLNDGTTKLDGLKKIEHNMAIALAAIHGGCNDPIPFMVVVDYLVREIWRVCLEWRASRALPASASIKPSLSGPAQPKSKGKKAVKDEEPVQKAPPDRWVLIVNIFDELALFAQGAVVYGAALRFPYKKLYQEMHPGSEGQKADTGRMLAWYRKLYAYDPRCSDPDCNRLLQHPTKFRKLDQAMGSFSAGTRGSRVGKRSVRQLISTNRSYCFLFHTVTVGYKSARGKRSMPGLA